MIKKRIPWKLRGRAVGELFSILLVFGCGSISQPARQIQVASVPESPPARQGDLPHSESPTTIEQNGFTEFDEKNAIFFSLGSSTIKQRERDKLRYVVTALKSNKKTYVTLIGHANDNGSSSFNLAVADARVESVVATLKKSGVNSQQIKKKVVGGEKISSACRSMECRQKMRRVEFLISTAP